MAGLVGHYFKFVIVDPNKSKYKCDEIALFDFNNCERYLPKPIRNLMESGRGERAAINKIRKLRDTGIVSPRANDVLKDAQEIFETIYAYRKQFGTRGIEQYINVTTHRNDAKRFADLLLDIEGDTSLDLELRQAVSILRENYWGYLQHRILT